MLIIIKADSFFAKSPGLFVFVLAVEQIFGPTRTFCLTNLTQEYLKCDLRFQLLHHVFSSRISTQRVLISYVLNYFLVN